MLVAPTSDHQTDREVGGSKVEPSSAGKVLANTAVQSAGRTLPASLMVAPRVDLEVGGSKVELSLAGKSVPVNTAVQNAGRTLQASLLAAPRDDHPIDLDV